MAKRKEVFKRKGLIVKDRKERKDGIKTERGLKEQDRRKKAKLEDIVKD